MCKENKCPPGGSGKVKQKRNRKTVAPTQRFIALCQIEDRGHGSPCHIWQGSKNFSMRKGYYPHFRRAAAELGGVVVSTGYHNWGTTCKEENCCALAHLTMDGEPVQGTTEKPE
jgi:hypothetical protein